MTHIGLIYIWFIWSIICFRCNSLHEWPNDMLSNGMHLAGNGVGQVSQTKVFQTQHMPG
jgi:hypothetical protein